MGQHSEDLLGARAKLPPGPLGRSGQDAQVLELAQRFDRSLPADAEPNLHDRCRQDRLPESQLGDGVGDATRRGVHRRAVALAQARQALGARDGVSRLQARRLEEQAEPAVDVTLFTHRLQRVVVLPAALLEVGGEVEDGGTDGEGRSREQYRRIEVCPELVQLLRARLGEARTEAATTSTCVEGRGGTPGAARTLDRWPLRRRADRRFSPRGPERGAL